MKESTYKSFDELPCFLNAKQVANLLGISQSSCYELMSEPDFPVTHIGKRMVVQKDKLIEWLDKNTKDLLIKVKPKNEKNS